MAPRFRQVKARIRQELHLEGQERRALLDAYSPKSLINALMACLPQIELRDVAADELGLAVQRLILNEADGYEQAKNLVRRLMWHMNEESGNIGWGIPEAFGAVLAHNERLALEYHRIVLSYIINTGHSDNYCDHDVLRQSCYMAVARVAKAWPRYVSLARPLLEEGARQDTDAACRNAAQTALQFLK